MSNIVIGQIAPSFTLPSNDNQIISLKDFITHPVVLYFYPKDSTQGCTLEANAFRDNYHQFLEVEAVVLGISLDSPVSHDKFITENDLPFPLLSDLDHSVSELYNTWQQKKMYGREYWGIDRTTFIIDKHLKIRKIISGVKPEEHVTIALETLHSLE